jgi:hypothetical protein
MGHYCLHDFGGKEFRQWNAVFLAIAMNAAMNSSLDHNFDLRDGAAAVPDRPLRDRRGCPSRETSGKENLRFSVSLLTNPSSPFSFREPIG